MVRLRPQKYTKIFCLVLALLLAGLNLPSSAATAWGQDNELVLLYFPRTDRSGLGLEQRELSLGDNPADRAGAVVQALLAGPRTDLSPVFPPGLTLRQAFVDQAGLASLDFSLDHPGPASGAVQERLGLWAVVNTLCLNLEEVRAVKILVDGGEAPTLFGHVNLSRPLLPDEGLIR